MQILVVVQVRLSFNCGFDLLTKSLRIVLDLDQFSDVMNKTASISLVRVFKPGEIT